MASPASLTTASRSSAARRTSDKDKRKGSGDSHGSGGEPSSARKVVDVACYPCRKRKGKCTGERPTCESCQRRGLECSYEHDQGLTRIGSLKVKLESETAQLEARTYLLEQLRTRSNNDAALLLALIRLGADLDTLVTRVKAEPDLAWAASVDPNAPDLSGFKK